MISFWKFNQNIFTTRRQELDRMQKVICEVYESLCNLKLAIDGTIVMSPNLRASLDAMYDARIPEKWMKVSINMYANTFAKETNHTLLNF